MNKNTNANANTNETAIIESEKFDLKTFESSPMIQSDVKSATESAKAYANSYGLIDAQKATLAFCSTRKNLKETDEALKNASKNFKNQMNKVNALLHADFKEKADLESVLEFFNLSEWKNFLITEKEKAKTIKGEKILYIVYSMKNFDISECKPMKEWVESLPTYKVGKPYLETLDDYKSSLKEINGYKNVASAMLKAGTTKQNTYIIKEQRKLL